MANEKLNWEDFAAGKLWINRLPDGKPKNFTFSIKERDAAGGLTETKYIAFPSDKKDSEGNFKAKAPDYKIYNLTAIDNFKSRKAESSPAREKQSSKPEAKTPSGLLE